VEEEEGEQERRTMKRNKNKKSQCGPLLRNINKLHTWEESENKVMKVQKKNARK